MGGPFRQLRRFEEHLPRQGCRWGLRPHPWTGALDISRETGTLTALSHYSSSTQRWSLNKCASEGRNIEEVRHKVKVSNHSATQLMRFWQKPNQGHCLLSAAMETTTSCQTGTCKIRWTGDYFVMTCSPLTPHPPVTIQTARPPISTGNIGKWLSEIFFGWKNYSLGTRGFGINRLESPQPPGAAGYTGLTDSILYFIHAFSFKFANRWNRYRSLLFYTCRIFFWIFSFQ